MYEWSVVEFAMPAQQTKEKSAEKMIISTYAQISKRLNGVNTNVEHVKNRHNLGCIEMAAMDQRYTGA